MTEKTARVAGISAGAVIIAVAVYFGSYQVGAINPSDAVSVVLSAPVEVGQGQLVVLDASQSDAESFSWEVIPQTNDFVVVEGGKKAIFSGSVGEYVFIVSAAKGGTVTTHKHIVSVVEGVPTPVFDETKVASWCNLVKSPTKKEDALRLAQSFLSVSAIISSDMTSEQIISDTVKSNRSALGNNVQYWEPFLLELRDEINQLSVTGYLSKPDDHAYVWHQIGDGLRKYAATL